jgi:hydroxylamine reductase
VGALVGATLGVGGTNLSVLKMLDEAHTSTFGDPVPTPVNLSEVEGKCILVSGHDLSDLAAILEQTAGKGINVFTHGEMMPAHSYPGLKEKYPHLAGHYGGPWQLQNFDFAKFPGPICMTTNCLMQPRERYKGRLFTIGATGWPGVQHIADGDYSEVIASALAEKGFTKTAEPKYHLTGFGHKTVLSVADKVIGAATAGDLKRIVLIGGCDGTEGERSYYTQLADGLPDESLILTLGCGKYRLLGRKDYGVVPNTEIPRLLDMGQCNDSYSAVVVASALAEALDTDINSLPLSIVLSWFEQKAVAVLLTLLHLGVRDIRIGPALPAFVTPGTLQLLVDNFNLMAIDTSTVNVEEVMTQ